MRTNLARYLRNLLLCSLLSLVGAYGQPSVRAHDLPNFIPYYELGADCLGVRAPLTEEQQAQPVIEEEAAHKWPLKQGIVQAEIASKQVDLKQLARQADEQLQAMRRQDHSGAAYCSDALRPSQLVVAKPEDAPPPAPTLPATLPSTCLATSPLPGSLLPNSASTPGGFTAAGRNYVEDYQPYDLCIRDWRFGRFTYRGLSRIAHLPTAPVAEISDAERLAWAFPEEVVAESASSANSAHGKALSQAIGRIEELQCELCRELSSMEAPAQLGSQVASHWTKATKSTADWFASLLAPVAAPQPLFDSPQFVIYEAAGKQFVLPVDQALAWQQTRQLMRSQAELQPETQTTPVVKLEDDPSRESLDKGLLKMASRQLANLGQSCLAWSNWLDDYGSQRLAAGASSKVR